MIQVFKTEYDIRLQNSLILCALYNSTVYPTIHVPQLCKIKRLTLIKSEDYKSFAEEAINTLDSVNTGIVKNVGNTMMYSDIVKTWKDVGDKVTNVLERMRYY
jgi:hypothetical protein